MQNLTNKDLRRRIRNPVEFNQIWFVITFFWLICVRFQISIGKVTLQSQFGLIQQNSESGFSEWKIFEKTEKTSIEFPFKWNGIWSRWQFSLRFSEPNEFPFVFRIERKLSPRSYLIQFDSKWNTSFLSVNVSRHNGGPIEGLP